MEVTRVNNSINEVENDRATELLDLTSLKNIGEVYDNKDFQETSRLVL